MGAGESGPMDLGGAKCSRSPSAASPVAFWLISPVLPAKPSVAGSPGRGGARERSQFSPSGGNGDKRTQGELPRRGKRGWPGPLVSFPSLGKKLAARRRRNLPARNETALSSPPHPSGLTASHLPPRGKALCGGAALIRPRGKAYNGRRRNAVSHKILLLTFLLRKVSQWSSLPPEFSHPAPAAPWTSGPPLSAWSAHPQCCGS